MTELLVLFSLFIIALCASFYYSKINNIFKLLCFLLLTAVGVISYETYKNHLGVPIVGYPQYEFLYIHHIYDTNDNITLWVVNAENLREHRLHMFPYSREVAKQLEQAQQETENGNPTSGRFSLGKSGVALYISEWDSPNVNETKE